ncbi:dual OB domain-containing protein [Marinobacterium stanieri]|uniref:dual OB domain-containing protein n=1 Tax=Marinobacterium stanieri TaxID=49186 RepID=UPI003A8E2F0A
MQKEILVLAKSNKNGGYCVGGIELVCGDHGQKHLSNNWVRPVMVADDGAHQGCLPKQLCSGFKVFDIIKIDVVPAASILGQPENWLLQNQKIRKVATLSQTDVVRGLARKADSIWSDSSTWRDDQVSHAAVVAAEPQQSLTVIQPQDLILTLEVEQESYGLRQRVFASFTHAGKSYQRITVTDPAIKRVFRNQFPTVPGVQYQKTLHNRDRYWLTLSLSPEWMGNHYVLAAAVLDHTGYLNRNYG